ncbi:MAG: phospho-N-acetylmuramoyl-pentapeptide-transferase [Rikenellaceae bacterium]
MLYHLSKLLQEAGIDLPGGGVFNFLSFRAAMSIIVALIITITFGERIIRMMQRLQIGEEIRDLGLQGQLEKRGTPTMGGLIILLAMVIPTLLFGSLDNIYILLLLTATVWLGLIGFVDDYIKVFLKNKDGLKGSFKIVGQVGLGLIVGITMWFAPTIVVREKVTQPIETVYLNEDGSTEVTTQMRVVLDSEDQKSAKTTIPFIKNNELDYGFFTHYNDILTLVIYVVVSIFVVTAVSNGANLTDGLDGLVTGVSAPIVAVLGVLAYLSGHIVYADYLNIMYIPGSGEMLVFAAAFLGALIGFLWYNSYPAQIFMGDTGSLAIGGVIAVFALCIRKELLLPLLCGVFLIESLSVIIQVGHFKYTKKKFGEGRRYFLMAPIHHHFQKGGLFETKIVIRFCIISVLLAAVTIMTLKIR